MLRDCSDVVGVTRRDVFPSSSQESDFRITFLAQSDFGASVVCHPHEAGALVTVNRM